MQLTIKKKQLSPNYSPIAIFNDTYLIRELDKFEIKHLKKLGLLNNLDAVPAELIKDFITP
jgi:hypothetical protein